MTCAAAWQQAILLERKRAAEQEGRQAPKLISVTEEGWRVTSHIGVAEWLQESFKLCRALGVQNLIVVHRLPDLGASGSAGSREARIAEGLIGDADTKVIYRQSPDQRELLRSRLGLSATEAELTTTLARRGGAVGGRAALLPRPAPDLPGRARAGLHRLADGRSPKRGSTVTGDEQKLYAALAGIAAATLALIWLTGGLAGLLFGSGWTPIPLGELLATALRVPSHLGDPRAAWPRGTQAALPRRSRLLRDRRADPRGSSQRPPYSSGAPSIRWSSPAWARGSAARRAPAGQAAATWRRCASPAPSRAA